MKVFILGKRWKVTCFNDNTYKKRLGDGSHAITILEDRKIYIRRSSLNKETIIHELVHGYLHELSYIELDLDDSQIEEFYCELIGKHGESMIRDSNKIINHFKK